ncbi:MAG: HAMP domain-containing sensor histidine kinase [Bacillota bacterium]|nr:HAMP domain-containing sensor histidine kinase [Bacillota bacterium]
MEKDRKRKWQTAGEVWKENVWFFAALLFFDCFCFFCLWLLDNRKSEKLAAMFVLFAVVIFVFLFLDKMKKKNKKFLYFQELFSDRNHLNRELNTDLLSFEEKWIIEKLREKIENIEVEKKDRVLALQQQQEYVETWVHEIKTPISWLTLMLENREGEMSPKVYQKLQYMNVQLQEYVSQILYFSRLSYEHKREVMEWVDLQECIAYVLEEYEYLLTENRISIVKNLEVQEIFTDRKNLEFLLSQAVSNSIQYRKEENGKIIFSAYEKEEKLCLSIEDNGKGASDVDLPFVFEKGFTGSNGQENKKSTGIGLYLVKKLTENMQLTCSAQNREAGGFRLTIEFPKVEKEELV